MSTQHTPGPWVGGQQGDANEFYVVTANGRWLFSFRHNGEPLLGEQLANLRLIAAAPDLLEALEMVRDADDDCVRDGLPRIPNLPRAGIDAAIALATGGSA